MGRSSNIQSLKKHEFCLQWMFNSKLFYIAAWLESRRTLFPKSSMEMAVK